MPRRWLAKLVCAGLEDGAWTQPTLATALARLGLTTARNESQQVTPSGAGSVIPA